MIKEIKKLSIKQSEFQSLEYSIYLPDDYKLKNYPLVLFLHGAGERGSDLSYVENHGIPKLVKNGRKFPFIILAPQCPSQHWWSDPLPLDFLLLLVSEIVKKYQINEHHVFCTGLSMGGYGTLALSIKNPELFSAIVPVCGGVDIKNYFELNSLKNLPIWLIHGDKDDVIPLSNSKNIYEVLKPVNKNIKLTVYEDIGHNSWDRAYNNSQLYEWILSFKDHGNKT